MREEIFDLNARSLVFVDAFTNIWEVKLLLTSNGGMRDIKEPVCGLSSMPSDQDLKKPGRKQAWWLIHYCGSRTQEAEERES